MQISFSLKDPATRKREISSLSFAMEELNLQEATIITYNEEDLIKVETGVIKIIPAWKYMLFAWLATVHSEAPCLKRRGFPVRKINIFV